MIYCIGGIKGGTGKTTVATNLSVMLAMAGRDVLLVDADDQESATDFAAARVESHVEPLLTAIQLAGKAVREQVMRQKSKYDDIVVDVGGRDTASQRAALSVADVYLVPFTPRSLDLWTLPQVESLIEEMSVANLGLRSYSVLNRCDVRGSDNEQAAQALREATGLHYLDAPLINRKAFGNASSLGLSVVELRPADPKAQAEIQHLYAILTAALDNENPDR